MSESEIADARGCTEAPCVKIEEALDEVRQLKLRVGELERQNLLQGEEIRLMKLHKHGQSSEKLTADDTRQGMLFDEEEREKQSRVDAVADEIKQRFGAGAIRRGSGLNPGGRD